MNEQRLLYGIAVTIISPAISLAVTFYPLSWHLAFRRTTSPIEATLVQVGPVCITVNRTIMGEF